MEQLLVLILIGGVVFFLASPFIAWGLARQSLKRARQLDERVGRLESQLEKVRRELETGRARPAAPPVPAPAAPLGGPATSEQPEPALSEVPLPLVEQPAPPPVLPEAVRPLRIPTPPPLSRPPVPAAVPVAAAVEVPPVPEPRPDWSRRLEGIDWEQFMGVRLFAWLGGLALLLAVGFFVKYSFEHDLIPPEVRVAIGYLAGLGLLGGGLALANRPYRVTSHTLCAVGVVSLYTVTFACRAVYAFPFFGVVPTFLLMVLVTGAAILLAVRLNAQVVAVLGLLGGFLTPILLSTGDDRPLALFTYIGLLDLGLIWVALARRWDWLHLGSALGTVCLQLGWAHEFFAAEKVYTALAIFLAFDLVYLTAFLVGQRRNRLSVWLRTAAILMPAVTLMFVFALIGNSATAARPGVIYLYLIVAECCLAAVAFAERRLLPVQLAAGGLVFLLLAVWTQWRLTDELLYWALAGYFGFAVLHGALPVLLRRGAPEAAGTIYSHVFPGLALVLVLLPILKLEAVPLGLWLVVLMVNLIAFGLALATASVAAILGVLLLTAIVGASWVLRLPSDLTEPAGVLAVIAGMALVFAAAGLFLGKRIVAKLAPAGGEPPAQGGIGGFWTSDQLQAQIPALSGVLPFLLLVMVVGRIALPDPSAVFGVGLLLTVLLLGLTRLARMEWLPAVGLGCAFLLESVWHFRQFTPARSGVALAWYLVFYGVYTVFPFVFLRGDPTRRVAWVSAALSGPIHFYLVYRLTRTAWPNEFMGLIPALFAVPALAGLVAALRQIAPEHPRRDAVVAWFGGVSLLFVTLVFPIQFDRQWLTISWALEGAALLWLVHRVPHPGLRWAGVGLLVAAFVRLALNPAVLSYHPRSATAIWNWYLYTYGLVTVSLFAGGRLLAPPRHRLLGLNARGLLFALGTILAFLLLNLEIADYFTEPGTAVIAFKFSGNFARDMTYSIAWAVFALALLVVGMTRNIGAARYGGMALLGVTLLKLFLHDLASLSQLYRVGALVGVAAAAIVASFLYQRFLVKPTAPGNGPAAS